MAAFINEHHSCKFQLGVITKTTEKILKVLRSYVFMFEVPGAVAEHHVDRSAHNGDVHVAIEIEVRRHYQCSRIGFEIISSVPRNAGTSIPQRQVSLSVT